MEGTNRLAWRERGEVNVLLGAVEEVQRFLREEGWPFMVIGGLAVQTWGRIRATQDVDISVAVTLDEREKLVEAAQRSFNLIPSNPTKFVTERNVLPLETHSGVPVDLICAWTDFELEAIGRVADIEVEPGFSMRVCTPEDLVVMKFISDRLRDREDVEGILIRSGKNMNHDHVLRWLQEYAESLNNPNLVEEYDLCLKRAIG